MGEVMVRETIEDIVGNRNAALTLYEEAYGHAERALEAFREATIALGRATPSARRFEYSPPSDGSRGFGDYVKIPRREVFKEAMRKDADARVWAHVVGVTGIEGLMDHKAKAQLRKQLHEDPVEVTADNVRATLEGFAADADAIFKRGIAECFSALDRRFKSHDGFRIGDRVVLDRAFDESGWWSHGRGTKDKLVDIERTFLVLSGRERDADYHSIVDAIAEDRKGGHQARQSVTDGAFFRVRVFRNGNAHLFFKDDELVAKVNRLLGEYYGAGIPRESDAEDWGRAPDPFANRSVARPGNLSWFPSPDRVAEEVVERAELGRRGEATRVLEPSAGEGALARLCVAAGASVDCVEVHHGRAASLREAGIYARVVEGDFLALEPDPARLYDRVVMNPPFCGGDLGVEHVVHALGFLAPDGCLVAVLPSGAEFRQTAKARALRGIVERLKGRWIDLPARSFEACGTNVNTVMLKVRKDGREVFC